MPSRPIIKVIQNRDFVITSTGTSVRKAAELMSRQNQGALVAVTPMAVSQASVRSAISPARYSQRDFRLNRRPSGNHDTDPVSVGPDKPFGHALHLMFEGGFRHMPVVDRHHRPIGIVSGATRSGSRFCIFAANCNCARTSRKSFDHAVPTGRPVAPVVFPIPRTAATKLLSTGKFFFPPVARMQ